MKLFFALFFMMSFQLQAKEIKKTYFIQFESKSGIEDKVFQKLTSKPCWPMNNECHSFVKYKPGTKLGMKDNFLFKVKITPFKAEDKGQRKFSLVGFHFDGLKDHRYFNPGELKIPNDDQWQKKNDRNVREERVVNDIADHIILLSFK